METTRKNNSINFDEIIAMIKLYLAPIIEQRLSKSEDADERLQNSNFAEYIRHSTLKPSDILSIQENHQSTKYTSLLTTNDIEAEPMEGDHSTVNIGAKTEEETTKPNGWCPGCENLFKNTRGLKRHANYCRSQKKSINKRKKQM